MAKSASRTRSCIREALNDAAPDFQKSGYIKPGGSGSGNYMKYIATRPRAEKHGEHGLFSSVPEVSLEDSMKEVSEHPGPVWTFVYSLKREDATAGSGTFDGRSPWPFQPCGFLRSSPQGSIWAHVISIRKINLAAFRIC